MNKSQLIDRIAAAQPQLTTRDVELAVKMLLDQMTGTLADGERVEIRGFGSFSLHYRAPRHGRNPKTGDQVTLAGKFVPHFKAGKELRERVNLGQRSLQTGESGITAEASVSNADLPPDLLTG